MKDMKDMKTMLVLPVIFAAAAMVCGCGKETDVVGGSDATERHYITISASAETQSGETSTKAVLGENLKGKSSYYWQTSDAIGVAVTGSDGSVSFYSLSLKSGSGKTNATFGGEIEGEIGDYAVYPYNVGHKISGTTLTYHLPSTYTYNGVDKECVTTEGKAVNAINSANPPLWAKISKDDDGGIGAEFKHLGGVLRIKVDKLTSSAGFLTVTADRPICGDFEVNLGSATPIIESEDPNSSNPDRNTVTINYSGAVQNQPGVFYIPLPQCEDGKGYSLTVKLGFVSALNLEYSSCTSTKTLAIERAHYKPVNITQSTMYKGGYKIIAGHKFIDLGLPSGLLWAETNVGATLPADFGNFYAWGETAVREPASDGYSHYDFDSYKYKDKTDNGLDYFNKYNEGSDICCLDQSDDAAYQNWGGCTTPTIDDVNELINKTTYTRTSAKNSNGITIEGFEFKSANGNSIFLPYNGFYESEYHFNWYPTTGTECYYGCYWTKCLDPVEDKDYLVYKTYKYVDATYLLFSNKSVDVTTGVGLELRTYKRYYGMGVRPVAKP